MREYSMLPKIDLHCHLDGSLSLETIHQLMVLENIKIDAQTLGQEIKVDESCTDLGTYLKKFELPLKLLKTPRSFEIATYQLLKEVALENMIYIEIRFAPFLSATNEEEARQMIEGAIRGLDKAREEFGVEGNLILCGMRHHSEDINSKILKLAKNYLNKGVCAIDLAGDEGKYPMILFEGLFNKAKEMNIPFTIHAGETGSIENVRKAVELGAKRIGHGIAIMKDRALLDLCIKNKIGIEMCPTSNKQTKAIQDMKDYPFESFMEAGLLVTLNTDNRTVSNTTIDKEIKLLQSYGAVDYIICLKNALQVSFATDEVKVKLEKMI